ncbi:hypothetical protein [Pseudomonas chlororaphis]|uniref:hypothetical protein n=1 Tax=Pseudomonas chlororaphis TaxID=587753 RepID=UPI000BE41E9C|nr:hypothetical protein [Pseudomonas chlororaphis]
MNKQRLAFNGHHGPSVCNYHIFQHQAQQYLVFEQLRDTTTSITNCIEHLIVNICQAKQLQESATRIFEYYPASLLGDQLLYEVRGVCLVEGEPRWFAPTRDEISLVKALVVPG